MCERHVHVVARNRVACNQTVSARVTSVIANGLCPSDALLLFQDACHVAPSRALAIVERGMELLVELDTGLPGMQGSLKTSRRKGSQLWEVLVLVLEVVTVLVFVVVVARVSAVVVFRLVLRHSGLGSRKGMWRRLGRLGNRRSRKIRGGGKIQVAVRAGLASICRRSEAAKREDTLLLLLRLRNGHRRRAACS
eukprot:6200880-Pleurochrysis_carterae.AAC.1